MTGIAKYEAARLALAEAVAVDEVLLILDTAEAMRQAARIAGDREFEIKGAQLRFRAERRFGELMAAQHAAGLVARGGRPRSGKTPDKTSGVFGDGITLRDLGVDYRFSSRAQKIAELPAAKFDTLLDQHADEMRTGKGRVAMDLLKLNSEADGRDRRRQLAAVLSNETAALPIGRKFPVVYADPPWHRKQGVTSRSYENHYATMGWDEICAMPVADLLLPDAWLFLWIPRAHMFALHTVEMEFADDAGCVITRKVKMPLAWAVARAWGCDDYSTAFVWTKTDDEHPEEHGGGVVAYDQDEILLLFKRGRGLPKPATDEKFGSNHRERSKPLGHSRKPEFYRDMIRAMAGGVPTLELFARVDAEHPLPADWEAWGNQAQPIVIAVDTFERAPIDAAPDRDAERADATMQDIAERLAAIEAPPELSEFDGLRAISDFCFPNRAAIVPHISADYVARGHAFKFGGSGDWSLTEAGWKRFYALDKARKDAAPDPAPEIVDGVLQCRLPLAEHELDWQLALNSIAAGEPVEGQIVHDLVGEGYVHATPTRLVVTDEGRAWLARLVDLAPAPRPSPPPNLPLFAAARESAA